MTLRSLSWRGYLLLETDYSLHCSILLLFSSLPRLSRLSHPYLAYYATLPSSLSGRIFLTTSSLPGQVCRHPYPANHVYTLPCLTAIYPCLVLSGLVSSRLTYACMHTYLTLPIHHIIVLLWIQLFIHPSLYSPIHR